MSLVMSVLQDDRSPLPGGLLTQYPSNVSRERETHARVWRREEGREEGRGREERERRGGELRFPLLILLI